MTPEQQAREIVDDIMADYAMTTSGAAAMVKRIAVALAEQQREIERLRVEVERLTAPRSEYGQYLVARHGEIKTASEHAVAEACAQRDALAAALEVERNTVDPSWERKWDRLTAALAAGRGEPG